MGSRDVQRGTEIYGHRSQKREGAESSVELNAPFRIYPKVLIKDEHKDLPIRLFQYCL